MELSRQGYKYLCFEILRLRTIFDNEKDEKVKVRIAKRYGKVVTEFNKRSSNWFWTEHELDRIIKAVEEVKKQGEEAGKWVTMPNGQHIFIREGESLSEATERMRPSKPSYTIEGYKDEVEKKIIHSSLKKLSKEDLDGVNKITIVDEADFYAISGEKIRCDASFTKSTGEMRLERRLLTSTDLNRVLYHEVAHNKWNKLSNVSKYEWSKVYHRGLRMGYKFPSYYSTTNAEEAYAECYAFYKTDQVGKIDGVLMNYLKNTVRD